MPVYEFRMPAAAAGLTVHVYSGGVQVTSTTAPASDGVQGPCVVSFTLEAGTYEARVLNGAIDTGIRAPGFLLVPDSFGELETLTTSGRLSEEELATTIAAAVEAAGNTRVFIYLDGAYEPADKLALTLRPISTSVGVGRLSAL